MKFNPYSLSYPAQKERSILYIQDLYLRVKNRHLKKREYYLTNVINRIINEIPIENEEKVILHELDGKLHKTIFTLFRDYGTWGHSTNILKLDNRTDRLFYLSDSLIDLRLELGKLHYESKNSDTYFHQYLWGKLEKMIIDKLNDQFKRKRCEKVFKLKVGDIEYIVTSEDPYSLTYKKFKINEIQNNITNLEF